MYSACALFGTARASARCSCWRGRHFECTHKFGSQSHLAEHRGCCLRALLQTTGYDLLCDQHSCNLAAMSIGFAQHVSADAGAPLARALSLPLGVSAAHTSRSAQAYNTDLWASDAHTRVHSALKQNATVCTFQPLSR